MLDYKTVSRNIRILYFVLLTLVAGLVLMCELHLLSLEGMLVGINQGTMYIVEVSMLFGVGLGLLAALKGFNWCLLHKVYQFSGVHRVGLYVKLNYIRIVLLVLLMLAGAFFYYATLQNWGMYYGLAALVVSFFCLPSAEGVEIELALDK